MYKEQINNLVKYLTKKGLENIKTDENCGDYIDIPYGKDGIFVTIRIYLYDKYVKFDTPGTSPEYKNYGTWIIYFRRSANGDQHSVRRKFGGENINKLKVLSNRKNINNVIYKKILLIQSWLDPVIESKIKLNKNINKYASELEFYFKDKYGNVELHIIEKMFDVKEIYATVKCEDGSKEQHLISYENGNYFLISINKCYCSNKVVYKQRKKKEKI